MSIPLFTLSRQSPELAASIKEAVHRVLDHQQFILGKEVVDFEQEIAKACFNQQAEVIGVSSGTDGLLAILMAKSVGSGDAVITTPYTFFATASCVHRVGAEIVFCDIDPKTYMMDPAKLHSLLASFQRGADGTLRTLKGNRVKMIIPIHLFGTCCDMDAIMELAQEYGLTVVEDAAQVIGADYPSKQGVKKAGSIADFSFVSFYPTKNLGAFGDAGLVVCRDPKMAEQIRIIRNHGMEERYYHKVVGGNFRLDGIQAAILRERLPFLNQWNTQRQKNAAIYKEAFTKASLLDRISLPVEPWAQRLSVHEVLDGASTGVTKSNETSEEFKSSLRSHHIYHQYVIRLLGDQASAQRDKIIAYFNKNNIGYAIYYPVPLHLQECFAYLDNKPGSFPESELAAQETLALPIFPELREDEIEAVVAAIAEVLKLG